MPAVYQHCGEQHLHRYLAEFDFRHNNRKALKVNDTNASSARCWESSYGNAPAHDAERHERFVNMAKKVRASENIADLAERS